MSTRLQASGHRLDSIERTISGVRIGAVFGSFLLIAVGGEAARSYRVTAAVILLSAAVYSIGMTTSKYRLRPEVSSTLDLAYSLGIIATTGAGRSVALALPFLALAAAALRFPPFVARVTAMAGSLGAAFVILLVPRPDLETSLRVELALGWSVCLLLASLLIGLLSDLELQEHEDLLTERERAKALQQEDLARRRTLRMVAHDLTPPLVAIEGIARTLQNPTIDMREADREEALSILVTHAGHLQSFAQSLREVANAGDSTKLQRARLRPLNLEQFLHDLCRAQTLHPHREVRFESARPLPTITTDADKLRRVVVNLLDNAVRHSPAGQPVVLTGDASATWVTLTVTDMGQGVQGSDLGAMFTPHWQGADDVGASGLGLWIVAELVGELGGNVMARNGDQTGLVVDLQIPLNATH